MSDGFVDAVALITGGAGGIGRAVSAALTARGAAVAVLDHAADQGDLKAALALRGDVADEVVVSDAVATVADELGPPTLLVCAAGVVSESPIESLVPAEFDRVVGVSLRGTYLACRAVAPHARTAGGGAIVAFSSGYGTIGYPRGGHYAAAKAGIEALVKSLAQELGPGGVRVNAVAPGPVRTAMLGHVPPERERDRVARTPLGRIATPDDVVGPTLFLLGPDSNFVTGQILHVNGGLIMP